MSGALERFEKSILDKEDDFSLYKDDLLGWIELFKNDQHTGVVYIVTKFFGNRFQRTEKIFSDYEAANEYISSKTNEVGQYSIECLPVED